MRDDYTFNVTRTGYSDIWIKSTGKWAKWLNNTNHTHHVARTFRSESVSTPRMGASYPHSTEYRAHFNYASSPSYSYETTKGSNKYRFRSTAGGTSDTPGAAFETYGCNSSYPHTPSVAGSVISKTESAALGQVKNNDFNLGQTLGEAPETIKFIGLTLMKLMLALRAVRSGRASQAASYLSNNKLTLSQANNIAMGRNRAFRGTNSRWKDLNQAADGAASAWLSLQYGWKPLMSDLYSATEYLRYGIAENAAPYVQASFPDENYAAARPSLFSVYKGSVDGSFERGCEVGFTFTIRNQTLYDLDRYGLLDPLSLAWELLPLSFVVDWFTGVGNFLDSWTRPLGLAFLDGYKTLYLRNYWTADYMFSDHVLTSGEVPKITFNQRSMLRTKYLTWPYPLPYLDLGIGDNQMLSVIALAKSLAK